MHHVIKQKSFHEHGNEFSDRQWLSQSPHMILICGKTGEWQHEGALHAIFVMQSCRHRQEMFATELTLI